jgi:hypothetical protein
MSRFKPAIRTQSRLRMALDGPPGSGKSFSALRIGLALARLLAGSGSPRVAVIDTERGSASKYAGARPDPDLPPWEFDVLELASFSPSEYTAAVRDAGREGYGVLVVDSLSHAWTGKDGALELKDRAGDKNQFAAWKTVTPLHNEMIDALLQSPCHVIVTMRSKVDYVLETDGNGKQVPKRVVMAPVQRPGMEYEFDLYGSLDWSHVLTVSKSRCPEVADAVMVKPGPALAATLAAWLTTGEALPPAAAVNVPRLTADQLQRAVALASQAGLAAATLAQELLKRHAVSELAALRPEQADDVIGWLGGKVRLRAQQQAAPATATTTPNGSSPHQTPAGQPQPGKATPAQLEALRRLRDVLVAEYGLTGSDWKKALANRGVESAVDLTPEQANDFIGKLRVRVHTSQMDEALHGPGGQPQMHLAEDAPTAAAGAPEGSGGDPAVDPKSPCGAAADAPATPPAG